MSLTAEEIIRAARDEHAAFSPARHPNAGLLRQLRRYHRTLAARVTNVNSSILAKEQVIVIDTFDFTLGFAFPVHLYVLPDGELEPTNELDRSDRTKFWLIGQNVRLSSRPLYSGWFIQDQFFLNGNADDWTGFVNVHLHYVAIPTTPVTKTANFDPLPDSVEAVLVSYLAKFMAGKGHADQTLPPIDSTAFVNTWQFEENRFLSELGERKKARRIKVLDQFPG